MPKIRTSLYTILFRGLAMLIVALVSHPAGAIVTRHDRDDARYVALGARFPAAVTVLPDGSGVLIAPNWVLTAGHVARGVAKRSPRVEIDGREHEVARVFVHPKWREMGPHDVGLLQLTSLAQRVTPAELYTADDEVGQVVTFVGRGDTGTGLTGPQTADGKKRGATNRVESADDDWVYFNFDRGDDATDLEGVSGPGDSGGPALVTREGKVYTVGVSVFSDGRGKGPGRYGVREGYTRVSTHRGWIESIVSGESEDGEVDMGDKLDWIVGKWKRESRRGVVYESWQRLSDHTVEGDSWIVSSSDGKRHPLESLLLVEMAGELFYIPKVAENDYPVPFRRTSMEPGRVVFENPTHDFPQKIIYRRTGDDGLTVTIEGPVDGGESRQVDFHFRRAE